MIKGQELGLGIVAQPVIPATQEAEIGRNGIQGQHKLARLHLNRQIRYGDMCL
jgi:hypothetical protein